MLVKLIPSVNFINLLWAAFVWADPKSVKKAVKLLVILRFWDLRDSERKKAAFKTLMNLSPVVNFIHILSTNILYKRLFGSFFYLHVTREKLLKKHSYKIFSFKCWWNWHLPSISSTLNAQIFRAKIPSKPKRN